MSVAGSDPSGGAGIQADLKAFSAMGAYGGAVLTALTAQSTRGVSGVLPVPAEFVTAQLDAVLDDLDVRAVKIGMLGGPDVVAAVAEALDRHAVPQVVVDPVMVATSGDRLVDDATVDAIRDLLVPLATVLTPNLPEAATLLRLPEATADTMTDAGIALRQMGASAVLVKGGHLSGPESTDVLVDPEGVLALSAARVATSNTHGTGCTLSSAIAASLAQGVPLRASVQRAKDYLTEALQAADELHVGTGNGPVHHFVRWWAA
nr:bifunctional hydroxymethylpyrimidine kinase/phosphomethylpyrimidine kinase [Motilibacter deserti]